MRFGSHKRHIFSYSQQIKIQVFKIYNYTNGSILNAGLKLSTKKIKHHTLYIQQHYKTGVSTNCNNQLCKIHPWLLFECKSLKHMLILSASL